MKSTGVTRKVDQLGRIVIPKELRKTMEIDIGSPLEIYVEDEYILLKKYSAYGECLITGEITKANKEYAPGLTLSPEGAQILLEQLQNMNDHNPS
ncbi:AbrB/MazE/SpoVT family DNA-binding domain-containing protein [Planococcus lenghuensis]|uniref:AbrB family transcriptional regulator n=1 Tax=Planococcus lenghuensis TaxID=2213202 RepID=A0A1Q2L501_9BACL|nr:AbrB/MazE/SpoVT family DNA-binding domain-containing protein [Planococcus lenghuensis]AQQ55444.1 AbrB family transcriptional regulator [Planococcus lenghuensis]